jgi:hypothetical protein
MRAQLRNVSATPADRHALFHKEVNLRIHLAPLQTILRKLEMMIIDIKKTASEVEGMVLPLYVMVPQAGRLVKAAFISRTAVHAGSQNAAMRPPRKKVWDYFNVSREAHIFIHSVLVEQVVDSNGMMLPTLPTRIDNADNWLPPLDEALLRVDWPTTEE